MKTNGTKIFGVSTVFLFAAVLLLSKISAPKPGDEANMAKPADDKTNAAVSVVSVSEVTPAEAGETESSAEEADTDADDAGEESETAETAAETTSDIPKEPKPDPEDADNTWAMFLVNSQNPVSKDYCDSIETVEVYESWREYYMDSRMAEYMKQMIRAASDDGIDLVVMSAYRSMDYQQKNFDNSVEERMNRGMTYDEAYADTLNEVQLPGYSEHNAGISADIMSDEYVSMDDDGFEDTKAFAWLQQHAAEYGFVLRYPKGKQDITGIIYEPWHYRFVGVYYANMIKDKGMCLEEFFTEMGWADSEGVAVHHLPVL